MGVYVKGLTLDDLRIHLRGDDLEYLIAVGQATDVPDHGDLIDIDKLSDAMYHEAFETDSVLQNWDSGFWVRYKMFEKHRDAAPVVIPAERIEEDEDWYTELDDPKFDERIEE